ncbi:MAG: hypothetical protein ACLFSA_05425 [Spirochaetaceae bacterium]
MLYTLHILALKPNQTRLLSIREKRNCFYRRFGLSSALAFEPVIPVSVCTIEEDADTTAPRGTPFKKKLFTGFSRSGKGADGPPVLNFSSLQRHKSAYFYPLSPTRIWETFNSVLEEEHRAGELSVSSVSSVSPVSPASSFQPIPPFPGIFVAAAEEETAAGQEPTVAEASLNSVGPEFDKAAGAPEPWRNYKLALFELQGQLGNDGKWWDGCSWCEVWELTLGDFS